ncbi:MAG: helix-turn-helix transcriptional regulator [Sphingopyxis sp.]|uniref:helix-turn-helix domain-containing protein n=1 Tax=Sphingopyxis sp. TaxID=1908224 RepID=UPI001A37E46B|nr:helix-turn-helix transcriptional regulator [Sphingopyxis sp.]MBL9066155.1 helix-turn-helix transcriptional regulator [Sphingopyxis sp.]
MDWNKIVGANVRRLRVERKLTQEQLAHDAEIDVTYLRGIEAGRRNPSVNVLVRIAQAVSGDPAGLFEIVE